MKRALLLTTCIVSLMVIALPAHALELGVRGYYWFPGLSGDIKVDESSAAGTTLDLETDLGFDSKSYPVVEAFAAIGSHHLSLSYYRADYSGTKTLSESITFKGKTFDVQYPITSSLEYDIYDITYQYDLLDLENILAGFSLGIVGKVKLINGDVEIKSTARTEKEDISASIPMIGVNLHLGIFADLVEARILGTGMAYGGGTIYDGQAEISYTPVPFVDIHGGYRVFSIDVDADDVDFNHDTSGPYLALTVSF